jgi:VanZ family protein
MRWVKLWWPAIAWAILISILSTGSFSAENTGRIIIPALHWLFPSLPPATLQFVHFLVRKSAHFVEYFILSLLLLRGIRAGRHEAHVRWAVSAVLIVAAYAALDEFHQSFVPGRTAAVGDVVLDTCGGVAAQIIVGILILIGEHRRRQSRALDAADAPVTRAE